MGIRLTTRRTGKPLLLTLTLLSLAWAGQARAAGALVQFTAIPDRTHIGQDDSLSLKISIRTDGSGSVSDPTISAPDFEVLNEEYRGWFSEPYPSRTTIGANLLSGLAVEVTVLAVRPGSGS